LPQRGVLMTDRAPLVVDRWISVYQDAGITVAAVFVANTDSSATEVWGSQHRGRFALARTRAWAWREFGRLDVRPL
jgi:hypothetical protein